MKKEDLIVKWLDNNCDERELQAFNQLDASSAFMKIDQAAQHFKAPDFDPVTSYAKLNARETSTPKTNHWLRYAVGIAAALILSVGLFMTISGSDETTYMAQNSQKTEFLLPDASQVILNADSQISYLEDNWNEKRTLELEGEAYFRVSKGSKFSVVTSQGEVSVLGTQFNVKSRPGYFEVVCYEGLVQVDYNDTLMKLSPGESFSSFDNEGSKGLTSLAEPTWLHTKSSFTSVPFLQVVQELERQYNIEVYMDVEERQTLFTGSFTHENIDTALQAITIPLNLSYDINGSKIMLKSMK